MDKKKKQIIIGSIALILVVGIVIAGVLIGRNTPHLPEHPEGVVSGNERPSYTLTYRDKPEVMVPVVMDAVKTEWGENFNPDKQMTQEEILAEFNLSPEDCLFVYGYDCSDNKSDIFIGFAFAEGKGPKVEQAVLDYVTARINDSSLTEKERAAWSTARSVYNPIGYVYLSALFDGIDELELSKVAETMEIRNGEALDIVLGLMNTQLIEIPAETENVTE